jgi:hypothetical protein
MDEIESGLWKRTQGDFIHGRSERKGSNMMVPIPIECRESKMEYCPRGGITPALQGLSWSIDTFHFYQRDGLDEKFILLGLVFSQSEEMQDIGRTRYHRFSICY